MIYLDYAATSPLDGEVLKAMEPYLKKDFGNPSSLYSLGMEAKSAIENSRERIAKILNCRASEIVFTAGGTESANLAIFGVIRKFLADNKKKTPHIIISAIEHHAVLHSAQALEKEGIEVTYLPVDKQGFVDLTQLQKSIRKNTILVSVMLANNEIGTIQPIYQIAKTLRGKNILLHTDACQAGGVLDLNVNKLGVDLMTLNGSKVYGPKQIGLLYIHNGVKLHPLIYGGGQEKDLRSGTENVPAIVGLGKALEVAEKMRIKENKRQRILRNYFIEQALKRIPDAVLNGADNDSEKNPTRLPNNINVSIKNVEGEAMVLYLDAQGICISAGSACTSTSADPSHVVAALNPKKGYEYGLRFTLGRDTTKKELDKVLSLLPGLAHEIRRVREMDQNII